ncbi:MAG: hypothetical protein A2622_01125 [Bdellovibrionales bacterium RIFCSPHIGHO2_01_FULL_40_29]|nr:MAG: hypothetical protein A2622_01125 [Bdellovibrionales bacterium RIFCSPHIGHO2_01_FULL_40_29]OFZ32715.1 MAG: hypothetical protein A3D17_05725 [Bdellovibrionales bacterium RIFCSPHIGHO2_02_FULL_40_15]
MRSKTTQEKALDINLDVQYYGSFAEIGAGQEVARQFFQAGKASQTVALSISAYDMTFSDIIYGKEKSGRYVCKTRLEKMLDKEYSKMVTRLVAERGDKTCFFSFADTVSTGTKNHGWLGVRFQAKPNAEAQTVMFHVRLLDKHRLQQQETLGRLGVNLLHSCFYERKNPDDFLAGLFDQIKEGSIAVDIIEFFGAEFKKFDPILFNLKLVHLGWADAILVDSSGQLQNSGDYLFGKSILVQRGSYNPVTNTHLDIFKRGVVHFKKEFNLKEQEILGMLEFHLDIRQQNNKLSPEEALRRVKMITALGLPALITRFTLFYQLKEFIRLSTPKPLAIVVGAAYLEKLFDVNFYLNLSGGLLEGLGKLLGRYSRLYVYPHKTKEICLLTKSFFPNPEVKNIYAHFIESQNIQDIAGCDEIDQFIHSEDVNKLIKKKDIAWKKLVPEKIHSLV